MTYDTVNIETRLVPGGGDELVNRSSGGVRHEIRPIRMRHL